MPTSAETPGYIYRDGELSHSHAYLYPAVSKALAKLRAGRNDDRVFELGCGNGSFANQIAKLGFDVTGVDASEQGIHYANSCFPNLALNVGSAYDDLAHRYGRFPIVISLEVVEHVYFPRQFAATVFSLLEAGGAAIISTPYHGYWKNVALAVSGKLDGHFTALWDHGHIKFWSISTLRALLAEAGFVNIVFERAGRVPALAKSMIAIARRPR